MEKRGKEKDKPTVHQWPEEQISPQVNSTSLPSGTPATGSTREKTVGNPTLVPGHGGTCTRPSAPYFALPTHLAMLPGSSWELVGWRRASLPCVSPAPTAGCSPASMKGNFSQLLPTLRRRQSSSSTPSAPNSHCNMHFDPSDPLTTPAASSKLHWWSFKASTQSQCPRGTGAYQANRAACLGQLSGSLARHHGACPIYHLW